MQFKRHAALGLSLLQRHTPSSSVLPVQFGMAPSSHSSPLSILPFPQSGPAFQDVTLEENAPEERTEERESDEDRNTTDDTEEREERRTEETEDPPLPEEELMGGTLENTADREEDASSPNVTPTFNSLSGIVHTTPKSSPLSQHFSSGGTTAH
jgi:hypothetical protein